MRVKIKSLFIVPCLILILAACVVNPTGPGAVSLPVVASVSTKAPAQPVAPISTKAPAPVNTKVPAPTPTQVAVKLNSLDINCETDPLYFTFNQEEWTSRVNDRIGYSNKKCYELVLNTDNTCVIGQFPGMGAFLVSDETKTYEGISFQILRLNIKEDGSWKVMAIKWDNNRYSFNVDLTDFDSPCWPKVEEVLAASAKLKFEP